MSVHNRLFGRGNNAFDGPSNPKAAEAQQISRATAAAVVAARSMLMSGGSDDMALRTAKAAAFSVLCPKCSENDSSSGRSSSYLRRRKLKNQAEVVASMALVTAAADATAGKGAEWGSHNVLSNRPHGSPYGRNITTSSMDDPSVLTDPTKRITSSVASQKTGPTVLSSCISSNGGQSHSQAKYPYAQNITTANVDEPSVMTDPTKKSDSPVNEIEKGTATTCSPLKNVPPVKDEHPLKLNIDRKATCKIEDNSSNWFDNFTNSVNVAWNILTCGGDCTPSTTTRDDQTLGTKMGMEISYSPKEKRDTVSTVTSAQDHRILEGRSGSTGYTGSYTAGSTKLIGFTGYSTAFGTEATSEYTPFQDRRDDSSTLSSKNTDGSSASNRGDSLVERWSRSTESEHFSADDSISCIMHSFSSAESDEIKMRSALRETMERVVEKSRRGRRTVPLNQEENDWVSYELRHTEPPKAPQPELSTRSRKRFAFFRKRAKNRLYEA